MKFDNWKVKATLGKGGNGTVYEVQNSKGEFFALKTINLNHKNNSQKKYNRFKDEIRAIIDCEQINGVIKIVDYYLPNEYNKEKPPYYVMPKGVPIQTFLKAKADITLFTFFRFLIQTLIELHNIDYTHRDIKPSNILVIDGKPCFSDFGLVDYPKKNRVTQSKETVGPKWTIAPEMKRESTKSEFKKADIYSLAKTLWILITRQNLAFEGQYDTNSVMSIRLRGDLYKDKIFFNNENFNSTVILEKLLKLSTDSDPKKRPSAVKFLELYDWWFQTSSKFKETNSIEWEETLNNIFPYGIPKYCEWDSFTAIKDVLGSLTTFKNLNHCFLPFFGGIDFSSLRTLKRKEELIINESRVIKPVKLIFRSLGTHEWSYFRIVLSNEKPISNEVNIERKYEYLHLDKLDNYKSNETKNTTLINRYLSGSIIIVKKTSYFNLLKGELDGYFGWHEKVTDDKYAEKWNEVKNVVELSLSPNPRAGL
ncbi:protein kinase domain-containing protein [Flavobacterium sp.]|uniref:protein kinase domain-containing protein n=1 Tax=Flavobacterium sp. TaxID=239 RepID=UPI003A94EC21